jgi:hypothetical protein
MDAVAGQRIAVGVAVGVALGLALGTAMAPTLGNLLGAQLFGMMLGVAIGAGLGSAWPERPGTKAKVSSRPRLIRRAVGWLLIVGSPAFFAFPLVDRFLLGRVSTATPGWVLAFMLLFLSFTVAFLVAGIGLGRDRARLVMIGGWISAGTVATWWLLFLIASDFGRRAV